MSAIFGLIHLDGRPVGPSDMERMRVALKPYGPDGGGVWFQGNIGLGQCLMRFTPEDCREQQPLFSRDGQFVLVSDARIDNRPELQQELGIAAAGELPDSAFILRAYEKWGEDCAGHLIGAFAFALCDLRARKVVCARSGMAERSFFYFKTADVFAFASAPTGLFALRTLPRRVNRQSIADFMALSVNEPGSSFFSGVDRLKAGHLLTIEHGAVRSREYRGIDLEREIRHIRDEDYVEAFTDLFDRVVADHLRSLTPVGVWLSGGLDSTTIAAASALKLNQENRTLHSFTAVPLKGTHGEPPAGWYTDETPFVEAMSRKYGNINVHYVHSEGFYLDEIDSFFESAESPIVGAAHLPWVRSVQRSARAENIRVLLNGTPGNFTISYDGGRLVASLIERGRLAHAMREVRALTRSTGIGSILRTLVTAGLMPLLPDRLWLATRRARTREGGEHWGGALWQRSSAIRKEFAEKHLIEERFQSAVHCLRANAGSTCRARLMLQRADRRGDARRGEERLFGVQNRDLPSDLRLVEFCLSIPEDQYLRDGTSRWLIRRAGADRLPDAVRTNFQRGMQSPGWFEILKAERARLFDEVARFEKTALVSEVVDTQRLRRLVERIPAARNDPQRTQDYRAVLEQGLSIGRFLLWAESAV